MTLLSCDSIGSIFGMAVPTLANGKEAPNKFVNSKAHLAGSA